MLRDSLGWLKAIGEKLGVDSTGLNGPERHQDFTDAGDAWLNDYVALYQAEAKRQAEMEKARKLGRR